MKNSQQHSILETLEQRALFAVSPDPGSTLATAFNVGGLTDANYQDFVGSDSNPSLNDPIDTYKFKMDAPGAFAAEFSLDNAAAGAQAHIALISDTNGNNVVDPGDVLLVRPPGTTAKVNISLAKGAYFLQITSDAGFSTYQLHLNADYAGTTAGTVRPMGSLDSSKSFNDFVGQGVDTFDDYSFSVNETRPLFAAMSQGGNGASFLELFRDSNNNGVADSSEFVVGSADSNVTRLITSVTKGNYILRVAQGGGRGTYTLFAETRPDAAGNTLKTAKNLGAINGLAHLDDYLSGSDPLDFYKFTAAASGTIGASIFCGFANADLSLIRDANNNGIVDKGDVLATGQITPMSQLKEFTAKISAGTYFLRAAFNDLEGLTSKYFVSFQTDYAGATPKSARNVGSLSGTKTFDDWASGPFSGAISDTADVYKFSLSSTRAFSAKLAGVLSGQDLDLQLYRDKNNDGVLSANELVASSHHLNSPNEQISKSLTKGTYFLKVVGLNGETNYHLTLKA